MELTSLTELVALMKLIILIIIFVAILVVVFHLMEMIIRGIIIAFRRRPLVAVLLLIFFWPGLVIWGIFEACNQEDR